MSAAAPRKRVICVGHAALDRVFSVASWPAGSGKIPAHEFAESGGGDQVRPARRKERGAQPPAG
jgi:hypothetical protein